jgi:hypothetical protein
LAAVGRAEHVLRVRLTQAAVFLPVLVLLSWSSRIEGAAMAVNVMMLVGVIHAWSLARQVVDYSPTALWFRPALALSVPLAAVWVIGDHMVVANPWVMLLMKAVTSTALYGLILGAMEGRRLRETWRKIRGHLSNRSVPVDGPR